MITPAWTDIVACAFFVGSACGVAVTMTLAGLGGVLGAVYVAVSAVTTPPAPCVVTAVSVPHVEELQPGPESDHERIEMGLEPGTGVMVATIVAVPPAGTLCGAVTCRVKLLVMLIPTDVCFDGSATLCAVNIVVAGAGRIPGAV